MGREHRVIIYPCGSLCLPDASDIAQSRGCISKFGLRMTAIRYDSDRWQKKTMQKLIFGSGGCSRMAMGASACGEVRGRPLHLAGDRRSPTVTWKRPAGALHGKPAGGGNSVDGGFKSGLTPSELRKPDTSSHQSLNTRSGSILRKPPAAFKKKFGDPTNTRGSLPVFISWKGLSPMRPKTASADPAAQRAG